MSLLANRVGHAALRGGRAYLLSSRARVVLSPVVVAAALALTFVWAILARPVVAAAPRAGVAVVVIAPVARARTDERIAGAPAAAVGMVNMGLEQMAKGGERTLTALTGRFVPSDWGRHR